MLVAEKQQYLESYDSRIHKGVRVAENPKIVPRTKIKHKNKVLPIMVILTGFALCSLTVARYAMIAQNHFDILKLEQALEEEHKKEDRLKLELSYSEDLKRVEEFAKNNLEMDYPDKSQVLYVELPRQNQNQADDEVEMANQDEKTLWDRIVSLLD